MRGKPINPNVRKGPVPADPALRFWAKVTKTETCWLWTGAKTHSGYGNFYLRRGWAPAHRFSYTLTIGPIPEGVFVCHRCDTPACVRPDHLFVGTAADNTHDMYAKGRQGEHVLPEPPRGEAHPWHIHPRRGMDSNHHRLTDDLVRYVRTEVAGGRQQKALAIELGISPMAISRAVRRLSWTHID